MGRIRCPLQARHSSSDSARHELQPGQRQRSDSSLVAAALYCSPRKLTACIEFPDGPIPSMAERDYVDKIGIG